MAALGIKLVGDWKKAKQILEAAPRDLRQAVDLAAKAEALFVQEKMKKAFNALSPPNSPLTVFRKGSAKAGVEHGGLRNAITVVKEGEAKYFVGIPATARHSGKMTSAMSLARIIEEGRTIVMQMTAQQRKFLHAMFSKLGKAPGAGSSTGILVIHIPARPFIKPAIEAASAGAEERFLKRVVSYLKVLKP